MLPFAIVLLLAAGAAAAAWHSVLTFSASGNNGGWSNFTLRQNIRASSLTDATASQVRITISAGTAAGLVLTKSRLGIAGGAANSGQFASTPVSVTWDSGSATTTITANTSKTSDPITLAYTGAADLVFAGYTGAGNTTADTYRTGVIGDGSGSGLFKAGDDADTVGALSGYSSLGANIGLTMEAFY